MSILEKIYMLLLLIPETDKFRLDNQDIYARIRDAVAKETGLTSEEVQDCYAGAKMIIKAMADLTNNQNSGDE